MHPKSVQLAAAAASLDFQVLVRVAVATRLAGSLYTQQQSGGAAWGDRHLRELAVDTDQGVVVGVKHRLTGEHPANTRTCSEHKLFSVEGYIPAHTRMPHAKECRTTYPLAPRFLYATVITGHASYTKQSMSRKGPKSTRSPLRNASASYAGRIVSCNAAPG